MEYSDRPRIEIYELMRARYRRAARNVGWSLISLMVVLVLAHPDPATDVGMSFLVKAGVVLMLPAVLFGVVSIFRRIQLTCPKCQRMAKFKILPPSNQVMRLQCSECSTEFISDCAFSYAGAWPEKRRF
jgi:hypothetical protein